MSTHKTDAMQLINVDTLINIISYVIICIIDSDNNFTFSINFKPMNEQLFTRKVWEKLYLKCFHNKSKIYLLV